MILTDHIQINEQLNALIGKNTFYAITEDDVRDLFPNGGPGAMLHISTCNAEQMLSVLKQEIGALKIAPGAMAVFFVSKSLLMQDLADLDGVLAFPGHVLKSVIFEESAPGTIDIYLFFNRPNSEETTL